ncbi:MAG: hypothetical protein CMP49_01545 [Flavobacteriales bacterium]|jgi:hypothetical protein|nr:hypothetical protein [Flavobacteriales bacterium]|tara:strand:- start:10146 stop:11486 length:1341 start_codon:yes stop_codon:yes gene_type:complete
MKIFLTLIITTVISTNILLAQIISYELAATWSKDDVSDLYQEYGVPEIGGEINYAVDGYKILYYTPDFDGELVICSGAIFLPSGIECSPPVLSWQHGTESNNNGVPSNVGNNYNDLIGAIGAANGYIVTMSDFIGLGEGEGIHNYVHAATEASSTIDLILYGKEFATQKLGTPTNNQLFLFGYSQGGHATMAAVREIEENYSNQLTITASCPMAGPYSMSSAQRLMLESGDEYPNPGYLPYVLFAYDKIYNLYEDINDVLISPYNEDLYQMYNGNYDMWEINNTLPDSPIEIFQNDYYQDYLTNNNHPFKLALLDNDTYEFIPQSPMQLIHCSGDDNVTYENSQIAYDYFIKNGAQNIELTEPTGGENLNHGDCAGIAILGAKLWIDTMAELCEPTQINEPLNTKNKTLVRSFDLLGRTLTNPSNNKNTIRLFSDGSYEKLLTINR